MKQTKALSAILASLDDCDSIRTVCPFCGGGTSQEASFNATREGDSYFWKCFRASCGRGGQKGPGTFLRMNVQKRKKKHEHKWEGECDELSDEWKSFMGEKVGFTDWHLAVSGAMLAVASNRVAFPIFDPMGTRRGWVLRAYDDRQPKALTFPERDDEPRLSYYRSRVGDPHILVVEDIPSAVRASMYTNAVALSGTGVSFEDVLEIAAHFRKVTWALDRDAIKMSLKWHEKYGGIFEQSNLILLNEDLKDMEEVDLCKLLTRG